VVDRRRVNSTVMPLSACDIARKLMNIIMNDGSRQFGELPQAATWDKLRAHIEKLSGASVTQFVTDHVTEAWIDFSFRGFQFTVNNQFGDYWFFSNDAQAPDAILETVLSHCRSLLGNESKTAHVDGAA
jgi:hypothetical protein